MGAVGDCEATRAGGVRRSPYRGPSESLTPRQAEVLSFCVGYLEAQQRTPSTREIAAHFGWRSSFSAQSHLQVLATKGYVELGAGRNCRLLYGPDGVQLAVTVVRRFKGDVANAGEITRSIVDWTSEGVEPDARVGVVDARAIETLINCNRHQRGAPPHRLAGWYLAKHGQRALLEMDRKAPRTRGAGATFHAARRLVASALGADERS